MGEVSVMSSVRQRYRDVSPVRLCVGGPLSSRLYCGEVEGGAGLVEAFLVELYRCKLCQFTCDMKASISRHLLRHRPPTLTYLGGPEGGGPEEEGGAGEEGGAESFQMDLNGGSKPEEEEDFLLYNMLDSMTPPPCDITTEGGLQVAHTCEVSTLFEEDSTIFPLKGGPVDLSMDPPVSQEEMEQSAHLMTLGLCRISACRPPPPAPGPPPAPPPPGDQPPPPPPMEPHCRRRKRRRREEKQKKEKMRKRSTAEQNTQGCKTPGAWRSRLIGRKHRKEAEHTHSCQSSLQGVSERKRRSREKKDEEEETDFCCSLCHRKFSSKLTLRRHLGVHRAEKPFTCSLCSYSSRLKASLLQHLRTHTGEKPYRCAECSYASIDRSSLLRHSRTHSQEKPYSCQHCDYSSIQKKSLDLHARRHHTGEAFPCQRCEYSSPDPQLLQRHTRRHHSDLTVTSQ